MKKKDSHGSMSQKKSSVISPGTGSGHRPTGLKGAGKTSTPVSNAGWGALEKERKGNVKALK